MDLPDDDKAASVSVPVTIRIPAALLSRIDSDVAGTKETRTDRILYLLQYAYDAGTLNQFIDLMKAQYLDQLAATPEQLARGVSSYNQVQNLADKVNNIEELLEQIAEKLR